MAEVRIREVTKVSGELVKAFARLIPQLAPTATVPSAVHLQKVADDPAATLLIAQNADEILGTLTLVVAATPANRRAWVEDVVVDEAARGKGVGEALGREAIRRLRTMDVKLAELTSNPSRTAANGLYKKLGFELKDTNFYELKL